MRLYYDFEATSVARTADPVSLGIIGEHGGGAFRFYAEFDDYHPSKMDPWVVANVEAKLLLNECPGGYSDLVDGVRTVKGDRVFVAEELKGWLQGLPSQGLEFWADFDVIDKPMLIDLIADWDLQTEDSRLEPWDVAEGDVAFQTGLPKHMPGVPYYAFYDLHTLLYSAGFHPDVSRTGLLGEGALQHNALSDATVCMKIHKLLKSENHDCKDPG